MAASLGGSTLQAVRLMFSPTPHARRVGNTTRSFVETDGSRAIVFVRSPFSHLTVLEAEDCDFRGLRPADFSLNSWGIGARPSCLTPINASLLEMRDVVLNVL